jgi:mobilome CxxCx(11)CxxC protein
MAQTTTQTSTQARQNQLRTEAWTKALEACGTGAILAIRARKIARWARIRDFLGIFVPVMVGTIVADVSFIGSKFISVLVAVTAVPTLAQLALSVWSLVANWSEMSLAYMNSVVMNNNLRREWEEFAKQLVTVNEENFKQLSDRTLEQEQKDMKFNIRETEKRYGMRYGLREFKKPCWECKRIPTSMKPTDCDVCGNF